jgi:hypothetical protein
MGALCPLNTLTGDALKTSHKMIVASNEALRTPVPVLVILTFVTAVLCPRQVAICVPMSVDHGILRSQSRISLSSDAVATTPSLVTQS